jgi:Tol biopolymer transport system component/DNA-binding winged helix-turn-helix (wHTH) protein
MSGQNQTVRFGPFELDIQIGELRKNNTRLKLQGQPIQILEMLVAKPGELVTREEIQQRLWPVDTFVDFDHSLNTAVKKLRQALGDEVDAPRYIDTLPKRGYRFLGEVSSPIPVVPPDPTVLPPKKLRWRQVLASCAIALLATAGGLIYLVSRPPPLPRITGSHLLVKNAYPKVEVGRAGPLTDGKSLYFQETRPAGLTTLQVPVAGGEVSEIPAVKGWLRDISRDGSEMLFSAEQDPSQNRSSPDYNVWTQPLPAGPPRLIVKGAGWPIWTQDGRGIFFVRNRDTELYRANADGGDVQRLASLPGFYSPHLSPDGSLIRFVAADSAPRFRMWEVGSDGSNLHPVLAGFKYIFGGSWSLDGKVYFFSAWDGDRYNLWAVRDERSWWKWPWWRKTSPVPQPLTFGPASIGPPSTSKDGRQIYASGVEHRGELSVYDPGARKFIPYLGGISVCYVDFSRNGQWMAYVSYPEGTLWRSKLDGSEKRQLTSPSMAVMNPRWSPDGKLIAFTDLANGDRSQMDETTPPRVYVVSADGGSPGLLLAGNPNEPTWSPDGKRIAYAAGRDVARSVKILDIDAQTSTEVRGSEGMWSPRWSPDGRYLLAFVGDTGRGDAEKLAFFSFATRTWRELNADTGFSWDSWSHDSKFVYVGDGDSLIRIDVANLKRQQVASVSGFKGVAYGMDQWAGGAGWFGLTPDDKPISTRDIGIEGIYAFDLEYK